MMNMTKTMRDVFIEGIYQKMQENDRLFFLSADFGAPTLDRLRADYPYRFINVGIAEQNLINVATGLALEGFTVYAYAIAPFLTMRAYEQIRNNLSLLSQIKNVNINLIGVGAGLSYDVAGPTHHCLEDITIMRTLPNIDLFSPSDWRLAEKFVDYSININKPKYIRFDGKPMPDIYEDTDDIDFHKGFYELAKGEKVCLVSTGYMSHKALKVASILAEENINVGFIDVFMLKPFNGDSLFKILNNNSYQNVITIEEAFINKGGLGSLISDILESKDSTIRINKMGFKDEYVFNMGNREYLHKLNGLDEKGIVENAKRILKEIL
jgi:transketolase